MLVVPVSGIRGCGKTSLIRELIGWFSELGERSAVIVNEEGEETYDDAFLQSHQVAVERLTGG